MFKAAGHRRGHGVLGIQWLTEGSVRAGSVPSGILSTS